MKLVLLGYMGSGKSTIGRLLSKICYFPFLDLDACIEDIEGKSIAQLIAEKGEIYFRKREAILLDKIILEHKELVLALGGGTPCYGTVMEDLLNQPDVKTIYLKNSIDTLVKRLIVEKEDRPLISHVESKKELEDFIQKHLFERSFYYSQAHYSIDCDQLLEKEIVEKIILQLF